MIPMGAGMVPRQGIPWGLRAGQEVRGCGGVPRQAGGGGGVMAHSGCELGR
jgi:hypothetical protein